MPFGQLVIGPPGAGKTVYCNGMSQFLTALGRRVCVVNLDPANDALPYTCDINIAELISLSHVTETTELGPNGGLIYCMEYLEKNLDWLEEQLAQFPDHYILFDCPGQVELYTHHKSVQYIVNQLQRKNYRLAVVHLVDSYYCNSAPSYVSVLLLTLSTMLQLEMPHVNVLSKIDLLTQYDSLDFNLDFYTEVMDLDYLHQYLDQSTPELAKLNKAICGLIQDFALVSFIPLNIQDKESVHRLVKVIDKTNGCVYGGLSEGNNSILSVSNQPADDDPTAMFGDDFGFSTQSSANKFPDEP